MTDYEKIAIDIINLAAHIEGIEAVRVAIVKALEAAEDLGYEKGYQSGYDYGYESGVDR